MITKKGNNQGLVCVISDASIDFTPQDFNVPLTQAQRSYLREMTGMDIGQVFWRKQVHEDTIIVLDKAPVQMSSYPDADAYVTNLKKVPIAIRTADCVPVFIFDRAKRVIGVAHAGWKGTFKEIAKKTVMAMQERFDCQWHDLWVYFGPAIHACCYTVGHEFKNYFPQDIIDHEDGSMSFDIIEANRRQLMQLGLSPAQILDSGECTCCLNKYFSFRRDKEKAGRMISLMMLV